MKIYLSYLKPFKFLILKIILYKFSFDVSYIILPIKSHLDVWYIIYSHIVFINGS